MSNCIEQNAGRVVDTMLIKLTHGEQARLWEGGTTNIQAFDRYMQGMECFARLNQKDN